MTSITIRQLRDTRRLKAWLREGQPVELRERNRVLARIVPASAFPTGRCPAWPDFVARARKLQKGKKAAGSRVLLDERSKARF